MVIVGQEIHKAHKSVQKERQACKDKMMTEGVKTKPESFADQDFELSAEEERPWEEKGRQTDLETAGTLRKV